MRSLFPLFPARLANFCLRFIPHMQYHYVQSGKPDPEMAHAQRNAIIFDMLCRRANCDSCCRALYFAERNFPSNLFASPGQAAWTSIGNSRQVQQDVWSDEIYGMFDGLGQGDAVSGGLFQAEKVRSLLPPLPHP